MNETVNTQAECGATVIRGGSTIEKIQVSGQYEAWCYDSEGRLKWHDVAPNLVTTVGKNDLLDKYLKGSSYTQTVRMGLCGAGTKATADTQASHAGWSEVGGTNAPAYTGNRPAITFNAAAAGSASAPAQAFAITSNGTVAGCFLNNGGSATKDDTTGVLYSAGDFAGGSKAVTSGDTINVTYTASA